MTNPIEIPPGLVDRVKAIVLKPKEEWPVIATEQTSIGALYTRYALLLAAIPAVAQLIGSLVFGYRFFAITVRPSVTAAVSSAIVHYVMSLVSVAVLAFIADFLAPHFSGKSDRVAAFKLAIYASTPIWLVGIFSLVPGLSVLSILGLYGAYLFYVGVPPLMNVPEDKSIGYTAAVVVAAIVISLIAGAVIGSTSRLFMPSPYDITDSSMEGSLSVPGVGSVDMGKLDDASKQMAQVGQNGAVKAVDANQLKAFLPQSLGSYTRGEVESQSMGAAGVGGSRASADYTNGAKTMRVEIVDMAAVGALAGVGAALGINSDREDAHGFERTRTVDGSMVTEKWNNESRHGSYSKVFANRFTVTVEGDADSFDEIKGYADSIDGAGIAALAS